ncbi:MAG: hypothetical protein CL847_02835 [Crocinitomicaceae bacterium]|nr:hypothetical protein [Crocinitomicaceae bacterium]|tara:strand:- start:180 stop:2486 length:2307 start_codon:yes stop_codon:yes gene_type:complete
MKEDLTKSKLFLNFIELVYLDRVFVSYQGRIARRNFYNLFKNKYSEFFYEIENEDRLRNLSELYKIIPNNLFIDTGDYNSEYTYSNHLEDFISILLGKDYLKYGLDKTNFTYDGLINWYKEIIVKFPESFFSLNQIFLKVYFSIFGDYYLNQSLDQAILSFADNYLSITIDEMSYDSVKVLNKVLFHENGKIKYYEFINSNPYIKILECHYFNNYEDDYNSLKEQLIALYATSNLRELREEELIEQNRIGELEQKQLLSEVQNYEFSKKRKRFSFISQVENIRRLDLIDEVTYRKALVSFEKEKLERESLEDKLELFKSKREFLSLETDLFIENVLQSSFPVKRNSCANIHSFSRDQQNEYLLAFSEKALLRNIWLYLDTRINQLKKELFYYNPDLEEMTEELSFLSDISPKHGRCFVEDLLRLVETFKNIPLIERLEKRKVILKIKDSYDNHSHNSFEPIYLFYKEKRYEINKQLFFKSLNSLQQLNDLLEIPNEILITALKSGNYFPTQEELNREYEITVKTHQIIDEFLTQIDVDYKVKLKGKNVRVKKHQEIIISILEPFFQKIKDFFDENIQTNQPVKFDWDKFLKLQKVYLNKLNISKLKFWDNWIKEASKKYELNYEAENTEYIQLSSEFTKLFNYLPYYQALEVVRNLNLTSKDQWLTIVRNNSLPKNIPLKPELFYKDTGWQSYEEWLGLLRYKKQFLSYAEARCFVIKLGLQSEKMWREYRKSGLKPINIPSSPDKVYKHNGWTGFPDFLGYRSKSKK